MSANYIERFNLIDQTIRGLNVGQNIFKTRVNRKFPIYST